MPIEFFQMCFVVAVVTLPRVWHGIIKPRAESSADLSYRVSSLAYWSGAITKRTDTVFKKFVDSNRIIEKRELQLKAVSEFPFIRQTILREFPYVRDWTHEERLKFEIRTLIIMRKKHFRGAEGFEISNYHKIIISATLARLTMGIRRKFDLPRFQLIEVYPREFYSRLIERDVKGLTLGNGRLFLSWAHFEEGHDDPSDKVHVGLHEFAHAIMIEFDKFEYTPAWADWHREAQPVYRSIADTENHFFRQYGGTNMAEFWAVTVETFFEQPREFSMQFPSLFRETCRMLNQRPQEVNGEIVKW